jgi:CheY-like chemotaxis protein
MPVAPWKAPPATTAILVVDDERYIVDLLSDLLEDEGYQVDRAYDGVAALEQIGRHQPDLVVADVMMPRLDGLSLADEINARGLGIPIILMSAAVTPRTDHVAFIPKPFDIDAMLGLIERLLSD